ncbi:hypothetical protein KC963_01875, partial [Candidatus Saccharibacteria bacterium]|nr:hypothetical protein [Candidatus Saccharibacteria bacterium]
LVQDLAKTKTAKEVRDKLDDFIRRKTPDVPAEQAASKATKAADETVDTVEEARKVLDDPEALPFQKKRAEQAIADARKAEEAAQRAADPTMKPTFQHNQEIAAVVKQQEDKLNKFVNGNPELTAQQIEAAREATQKQTTKLVEDLQAGRRAGFEATQQQADTIAKTAEQQAQTNADVAAERVAASTPPPSEVAQEGNKVIGSPELQANQGTRQSTEDILYGDTNTFQERGRLSIPQLLSPDRIWRENVSRPLWENLVDKPIAAAQRSDNRVARGIGRFFTGFSREAGITPELQTTRMQLRGGIEKGKVNREAIANLSKGFDDNALADMWATIDTRQAARMGKNIAVEDLSPEQQALRQKLVDIRDNTTVENMRRNLITREQAANGEYIMRDYSVLYEPGSEVDQFVRGYRQELMGLFKGRKQVTDDMVEQAITDPTYLVGKKQAQSEAAWAIQDYSNYLAKEGIVSDVAKPGFAQLPSTPLYGDAAGKYIPRNLAEDFTGFQYDMAMVSAFNDMITAYDRWGIRQAKKQLLTIFNPAVRLGNQVTNRGIFSQLAGINPVQFNIAMQTAKKEIANGGQLYREAVEQGLTGVDITQAEFFANRIAKYGEDKNIAKKALDWTRNSYSGADDQARVAAYMVKRGQGYDPVEAARQVQRGFQDYKSVGFFYDMAAKTPIIGNAFVRFAADSIRIAKNAALDHPLRTAGTIAAWAAFVNGMSVISGESELKGDNAAEQGFNLVTGKSKSDAQKEREGRSTAPKLPFTDISMTVQTPWGEVNTARFMPWYELSNIEGGGFINKVLPIEPPVNVKDGKVQFNPQAMDDPLLGQFVQIAMDKDFRGESIQDPNVNPENADQFRDAPLTGEQKRNNVLRFLFNNNAPLGRELDQTGSAYANTNLPGADKAMEI